MNGDFGASVEPETSSSANNSPTARMFAPSKQPLKSESGKHWIKPNRGALGAGSDKSGSSEDPSRTESSPAPVILSSAQVSKVAAPVLSQAPVDVDATVSIDKPNSNDSAEKSNELNKRISYKYIPLELASATSVKNSIAKNILYQSLGHGLMVIKYGRQGGPKQRILYCDSDVTKLYWTNSLVDADAAHTSGLENQFDPTKMVNLAEVLEVRAGTDLDPETPLAALKLATKNGNHAAMVLKQKKEAAIKAGTESKAPEKKKTFVSSLFGTNEKEDELLYGTAILRKKAKPEEFAKCLSLITQDRTIDFQCFSKKDYNLLYINLKEIVNKLRNPTTIPASLAPAVSEFRETLSTKKSVRFATAEEAQAFQEDRVGSSDSDTGTRGKDGPKAMASAASFATTMTDSSLSAAEVIELKDGESLDKLLEMPPSKNATAIGGSNLFRTVSSVSDSGHNPNTFSDEQQRAEQEMVRKLSGISGLSLDISTYDPTHKPPGNNRESSGSKSPYHMKAHEALQIGLILSQQEQQFGTNMYQSLRPEDEPEIEHWNNLGFSTEEAILKIFQKRFQPDLQEEEPVQLHSSSCKFDYEDQFSECGETFSGSMKSSIGKHSTGRQSSFFPQVFSDDSDSEAGGSFAADAARAAEEEEREGKEGKTASQGAMTQRHKDMMTPQTPSPTLKRQNTILRLSSSDALQIGLLLSQQEEEHGVNMYDSLEVSDESTIRKLCQQGYSNDEAVLEIFNRKFGKMGPLGKASSVPVAQPNRLSVPPSSTQSQAPPPMPSPAPQNMSTPPLPPSYQQSQQRNVSAGDMSSPPPPYRSPSPAQVQPGEAPPPYRSPSPQMPGSFTGGGAHQRSSSFSDSSVMSGGSQNAHTAERQQAPPPYEQHQPPQRRPSYERQQLQPPQQQQQQQHSYERTPSYGSSQQQPPSYERQQQEQQPSYERASSYERPQQPPHQHFSPEANGNPPQGHQYQYQPQYEPDGQYRPPAINTQPPPRQVLQRTNSLAQSSFFPNDPNVRPQYAMHPNGPPPAQGPGRPHTLTRQSSMLSPRTVSRSNMLTTLTDDEAVNMALLLSQQESDHGINMYDSLRASDEQELQNLIASGYTNEQAVLFIFEKRYPPKNVQRAAPFPTPQPVYTNQRQSMYNMQIPPSPQQWEDPNMVPMGYMQPMPSPQPMYQMPPPNYGPPPVRMMPRQTSMYAPPPMPVPMPMPVPAAIQQQHQLHTMYSSQYNMNVDPSPMPMMRTPQPSPGPMVRPPLPRTQSIVVPTDHDQRAPSSQMSPPVVTVVSAVPIMDDDDRAAAPQATHVGYNLHSNGASASTSVSASAGAAVSAAPWSPPPVAARPPPQQSNSRPAPGPSPSNSSVSSQSREPPPKLVKKRSIFNFVSSDGGGPVDKPRYKEADVRAITKMGYSKEQAVWALLRSNNNLAMAIDALCNS